MCRFVVTLLVCSSVHVCSSNVSFHEFQHVAYFCSFLNLLLNEISVIKSAAITNRGMIPN